MGIFYLSLYKIHENFTDVSWGKSGMCVIISPKEKYANYDIRTQICRRDQTGSLKMSDGFCPDMADT